VRDFQAAVADLGHSIPASNEPLPERTESKAYVSHEQKVEPVLLQRKTFSVARPRCPRPRTAVWLQSRAAGHATERFLFHLTPNAPPSLA
jgi:hypothetical protein